MADMSWMAMWGDPFCDASTTKYLKAQNGIEQTTARKDLLSQKVLPVTINLTFRRTLIYFVPRLLPPSPLASWNSSEPYRKKQESGLQVESQTSVFEHSKIILKVLHFPSTFVDVQRLLFPVPKRILGDRDTCWWHSPESPESRDARKLVASIRVWLINNEDSTKLGILGGDIDGDT